MNTKTTRSPSETARLIAAYEAQEHVVLAAEILAPGEDDPQLLAAHANWWASGERLFAHTPATVADLVRMAEFFGDDDATTYNGKAPSQHLRRMIRDMAEREAQAGASAAA